jgi:hypothetical protein
MEAQLSDTATGDGIFTFDRIILPHSYIERPIAVQVLLRKLQPGFLDGETGMKIREGVDHDDFMQLVDEQAVKGHDRGFAAAGGCVNIAAIRHTGYAYAVSFDFNRPRPADSQRIGEAWLCTISKGDFNRYPPGTRLFHYA